MTTLTNQITIDRAAAPRRRYPHGSEPAFPR